MSQAKILVIGDDPAVLDVLHETLTESEFIVFFASDGSRGIQLAKDTPIHAVVPNVQLKRTRTT
jgi:DNA-binding response OmpR family regulator